MFYLAIPSFSRNRLAIGSHNSPYRNTTGPVANLVDFFPLLQKLPNRLTSRGRKLHQDIVAFNVPRVADVEARLKRGEHVPDCLAKTLYETREEEGLDDADIIVMCGALIIGGVNTVRSALLRS